ncbi:hypothetical protein KIMH_04410 [Bombiscardovia apis]|uniref:YheO-like protein n=1 Tax=Bombiscardovia apis TaxID=2932182 RepID=A0ABM8BBN2_9BIFI|nr:helix-turn-helix transcriptional regulator [Bombiscardovia apis]BDR54330.1 hypothetical protein KIMH_04410 [Bombiscardovia apis]
MHFTVHQLEEVFPLADFLSEAFGSMAEIVVHDVQNLESSVVYIKNGKLSGRKVGDGTTDQALRLIKTGSAISNDYVANYRGKSLNGHIFRSFTYFIKDDSQSLIGLLCINVNVTGLNDAIEILTSLSGNSNAHLPLTTIDENLQGDSSETIKRMVHDSIDRLGLSRGKLSKEERLSVIRDLHEEGVFLMKGAVPLVAPEINVSIPTLYRYLQEFK